MLNSLAEHYGFDIDAPFNKLARKYQKVVLHGSGDEEVCFNYINDRGDVYQRTHAFEGVIPNFERRYRDTESQMVREELAKYLSSQNCPDCQGTRLREEARHVFIKERNLPSLTKLPVSDALSYFEALKLKGKQGKIAEKILKEIRERLQFLVDVGLNYLTLDRSAETLSGGEAQRVAIARALANRPRIILADEPTAALDSKRAGIVMDLLRRLATEQEAAIIAVTHDEKIFDRFDHIFQLRDGRLET